MTVFVIDPEKCNKDGICVDECPLYLIAQKDKDSIPVETEDARELCINCGHCVAVCPTGAIALETMKPEDCPPVQKELALGKEQLTHFLRSRRSIRIYKDKKVEREVVENLIDLARYAPSGHNIQPVNWHVIYDSEEVQNLAGHVVGWMQYMIKESPEVAKAYHMERVVNAWNEGVDVICRSAPHVIIAHGLKDLPPAQPACTIALTHLELAAPTFGLGACWAGYFNVAASFWPPMQKALGLPKENISYGALMVGYPKYKYFRLPQRNPARITWK